MRTKISLYECIAPFTYTSKYNRKLSNAIYSSGSERKVSFGLLPTVDDKGLSGAKFVAMVSF